MPSLTQATPQRRPRRRKAPKTSEKENAVVGSARPSASTAESNIDNKITKRRARKPTKGDDMVLNDTLLADDNIVIDLLSAEDEDLAAALLRFQDATSSTDSLWTRHTTLVECVLRASQSLNQMKSTSRSYSPLLLEEHLSELLAICRTSVKDATEQTCASDKLERLYVAIHGLRALCPLLTDLKRKVATMKVLYHAVTTASDVCAKSKDMVVCTEAATQCVAAFQALGCLLNECKIPQGNTVLVVKWKSSETTLLPLPILSSSSGKGGESDGSITIKQLCKIAMQAALSVANSLAHLYCNRVLKRGGGTVSNYINDFGSFTNKILQQTGASYDIVLRIVQEVVLSWTCVLCTKLGTPDLLEDSLSYAKRAFRLLFDVASHIDKSVVTKTNTQRNHNSLLPSSADSLRLRKHAILAYLLQSKSGTELAQTALRAVKEHHWETACTYACKASVAYRQQLVKSGSNVGDDECLNRFHEDVGGALDFFATTHYSFSYVEYSAYRALHTRRENIIQGTCQSSDCAFGHLGFQYAHGECLDLNPSPEDGSDSCAAAGNATLATFYLGLVILNQLDPLIGDAGQSDHERRDSWAFDEEVSDGVIARFRSVFIDATDLPPYDVMHQCQKLLEALGLNRQMYLMLSQDARCSSSSTLNALEASGRVLAECIGPLAVTLARCKERTQKQQSELAVDSFVRSLGVFNRVRDHQQQMDEPDCEVINSRTDDVSHALFRLCSDCELESQLSEETLEKAAKTVFSVGRTRREVKDPNNALLPLCLGTDLFAKLVDKRGPDSVHESQISMRYSHLVPLFAALDMRHEACLSLVLAIVYDIVASVSTVSGEDDGEAIHFLRELSSLTNGVVIMGGGPESRNFRRSLVTRLVALWSRDSEETWTQPVCSKDKDFVLCTRTLLCISAGCQRELHHAAPAKLSLAALLSSAFQGSRLLRLAKKTRADAVCKEQLLTMADVVAAQATLLQQEPHRSDAKLTNAAMKEFNKSFQYLEWLAKNMLQVDEGLIQASISLVRLVGAASLVPIKGWPDLLKRHKGNSGQMIKDDDARSHARNSLSGTTETIRSALDSMRKDEHRLLSLALLASVALYTSVNLADDPTSIASQSKTIIISSAEEAVRLLIQADSISDDMRDACRMCLTRTLIRFQDMVNMEGDKLTAAQAALLVAQILKESGTEDSLWCLSNAVNLLLDGGFNSVANDILDQNLLLPAHQAVVLGNDVSVEQLFQLETISTRLRVDMQSIDTDTSRLALREVKSLLNQCHSILSQPEMEQLTRIVLRWVCSSCAMALAEGLQYRGEPNGSATYLVQGVSLCRDSLSAMRNLRNPSGNVYNRDCTMSWTDVALSTFPLRLNERRIEGQQQISVAYAHLGDYRKSEAYAVGVATECMVGSSNVKRQRLKINELASIDRNTIHAIRQSASYRLLLEMKTTASPFDRVLSALNKGNAFDRLLTAPRDLVAWHIDKIKNLINAGDIHYLSTGKPGQRFKEFYQAAEGEMKSLLSSPSAASFLSSHLHRHQCHIENARVFGSLYAEVQLRRSRVLLSQPSDERNEEEARGVLTNIIETSSASATCRAWSHYYIGLLHIEAAKQAGDLQHLWSDRGAGQQKQNANDFTSANQQIRRHDIAMARSHLRETLALVGPASNALSRDAMRSLALLAGPTVDEEVLALSATGLIHSSIGATSRQIVTNALKASDSAHIGFDSSHSGLGSDDRLHRLFESLDHSWSELSDRCVKVNAFFEEANKSLPRNCRVVAVALCPTGEILVSSMSTTLDESYNLEFEVTCVFPDTDTDSILDCTVYNDIMKPLDELIRLNENQIRGLDTATVADSFTEEKSKRDWWNARQRVDDQLQSLVEDVESMYFSSESVKRVFLGDHDDSDDLRVSCGNLASKFEEACVAEEVEDESLHPGDVQSMTVNELIEELETLQVYVSTSRKKPNKKELINMLSEAREAGNGERNSLSTKYDELCTLLVLDENLHRFPFEGMEICSKWAVSRVPSLPFAIAPLIESLAAEDEITEPYPGVDPAYASCIVDPEGNLPQTKNRLVPAISSICESHAWDWKSIIGSLPPKSFVQDALTQRNGLLLYCGHGGATCCFSRSQIEQLMKHNDTGGARRCKSTIVLMGCSSGKLVSVNRKDSEITDKVTMFYEPEGTALSYLCAGSPCVVGNLWDVTDRDIDRYCITLLDRFLGSNHEDQSLAKCVAEARSSCKMRHIVGLAPVCYGVPVHLLRR